MSTFHYTSYAQEIIFGSGSLARLSEAIDRFHWRRLLLCSTGSLRRDGTIAALERALGADRLPEPHYP
jgi:alcohol dehydrogenase YqhD (iron-dependent ADH family)